MQNIHVKTSRYALCVYNQLLMYHKYILNKGFLNLDLSKIYFPFAFTDSYVSKPHSYCQISNFTTILERSFTNLNKWKSRDGGKSVAKIFEKLEVILLCSRAVQTVICLAVKLVWGCLPILGT